MDLHAWERRRETHCACVASAVRERAGAIFTMSDFVGGDFVVGVLVVVGVIAVAGLFATIKYMCDALDSDNSKGD
jgi:hypothetical protein